MIASLTLKGKINMIFIEDFPIKEIFGEWKTTRVGFESTTTN